MGRTALAVGFAGMLAGTGTLAAQDADLVADRPGYGESASAVDKGRLQIETGAAWTRVEAGTHAVDFPEALARIGLTKGVEVRVLVPDWVGVSGGRPAVSGWTDATMGLKGHVTAHGNDLALRATVFLPTGSRDTTEERADPEVAVSWNRSFPAEWSLGATVSLHRFRLLHETLTSPSITIGHSLGKHLATFLEYGANLAGGMRSVHKLDNGYTWLLRGHTQLDASVGVGLSAVAPDFFVGLGFCRLF